MRVSGRIRVNGRPGWWIATSVLGFLFGTIDKSIGLSIMAGTRHLRVLETLRRMLVVGLRARMSAVNGSTPLFGGASA